MEKLFLKNAFIDLFPCEIFTGFYFMQIITDLIFKYPAYSKIT